MMAQDRTHFWQNIRGKWGYHTSRQDFNQNFHEIVKCEPVGDYKALGATDTRGQEGSLYPLTGSSLWIDTGCSWERLRTEWESEKLPWWCRCGGGENHCFRKDVQRAAAVGVCVCVCALSHIWLVTTPWTVAHQPPLVGFPRQEYWSELPFLSPGDLPDPEIEPKSLVSPPSSLGSIKHTAIHWQRGIQYSKKTNSCKRYILISHLYKLRISNKLIWHTSGYFPLLT